MAMFWFLAQMVAGEVLWYLCASEDFFFWRVEREGDEAGPLVSARHKSARGLGRRQAVAEHGPRACIALRAFLTAGKRGKDAGGGHVHLLRRASITRHDRAVEGYISPGGLAHNARHDGVERRIALDLGW